jgi:prepilin-type N-terminal cleavage/methylation domain-containing protein
VRTIIEREAGFTIIEMMVVLILISILALMATVNLSSTSNRAYVVAMQSDLRDIATAQEAYVEQRFAETGEARYANRLTDLDVNLSSGVQIRMRGNQTGWSARATHQRTGSRRCSLARGTIRPYPPATTADEGKIICD